MMSTSKLIEVVANLASYDPEMTIYAPKPWSCDSDAIVAREPDGDGLPREAMGRHAAYFIEVFVAKEFLDGWTTSVARPTSAREQCERLIQYAINDA
jgi:hypothetical protein